MVGKTLNAHASTGNLNFELLVGLKMAGGDKCKSGDAGSSQCAGGGMSGSCNLSVTVNGGTSMPSGRICEAGKQVVTITPVPPGFQLPLTNRAQLLPGCRLPLTNRAPVSHVQPPKESSVKFDKIFLKAVCLSNAKSMKTFVVRKVDTSTIHSVGDVKKVIRNSLRDDIIVQDFDVGYIQGANVVRIRSKDDLSEMWAELKLKNNVSMWCDGLVSSKKSSRKKRKLSMSDDESDDEPLLPKPRKKRASIEERVQELIDKLQKIHGSKFTTMQVRIWAELVIAGMHRSLDEPPQGNSMFERVGSGGGATKSVTKEPSVAKVVYDAASAISSAFSPKTVPSLNTGSPAKLIESRSKLYKQLSELQNLKSMGVLTDTEYIEEKETIMGLLGKLGRGNNSK